MRRTSPTPLPSAPLRTRCASPPFSAFCRRSRPTPNPLPHVLHTRSRVVRCRCFVPWRRVSGTRIEQNANIKPLCEEEEYMRIFYEQKIQEVCKVFQFPNKIQATSLIYFKRFYLQWSVMQHHLKNIMLTCIYASCKVEENHVSAEELGKGIKQDHKPILNNEMLVLQVWYHLGQF